MLSLMNQAVRRRPAHLLAAAVGGTALALSVAPAANAQSPTHLTIGMPSPATTSAITSDDQAIAWGLKHGTPQELKDMSFGLNVSMPADALFGTPRCVNGSTATSVWVINFSKANVNWNITLDGRPFASATSLPRSHGYAALTVPAGKHTLNVVNAASGNRSDTLTTKLTCSGSANASTSSQSVPVVPSTSESPTVATAPSSVAASASSTPAATTHAITEPSATGAPVQPASTRGEPSQPTPVKPSASAAPQRGPEVQTDAVAPSASLGLGVMGVGAALVGGMVWFMTLMRRSLR